MGKLKRKDALRKRLNELDWGPKYTGCRAFRVLSGHLGAYSRSADNQPTVGEVLALFEEHARKEKPLKLQNYYVGSYEATRRAFRKLGIDLPDVYIG
jgi:hypothetical protein